MGKILQTILVLTEKNVRLHEKDQIIVPYHRTVWINYKRFNMGAWWICRGILFGGHHHHYGGHHHSGGHHFKGHDPSGRHHHHSDYGLRGSLGIDGGKFWPYYRRDSSPYNGVYGLGYGGGYPLIIYIKQEDSEKADTEPQTNDWSNWNAWHWCSKPEGYYPYVKKCLNDWIPNAPQPTASKD